MGYWKRIPGGSFTRRAGPSACPWWATLPPGSPPLPRRSSGTSSPSTSTSSRSPARLSFSGFRGIHLIDEGIHQGDLVVIEKGREPKSGDIVIAEVDGEWTLKFFRKKGKDVFLEAANVKYPPIRARSELRVGGVVSAVVRKYPG